MEDNDDLLGGIKSWMDSAKSDVENFKKLTDASVDKLSDEDKKKLNDALEGVDMKSLNKTIEAASADIMNQINGMFK